jgi:hypothetical protein
MHIVVSLLFITICIGCVRLNVPKRAEKGKICLMCLRFELGIHFFLGILQFLKKVTITAL